MTVLDPSFRRQCEWLYQTARRQWGPRFLGQQPRVDLVAGTQATGLSDYVLGDDLRYVDWHVSARHDDLLSRQFHGREDHHLYVLVDCSASMQIGQPSKFETSQKLAAAIGYLGLSYARTVQVLAFAERVITSTPPLRGRQQIPALLGFIQQLAIRPGQTSLKQLAADIAARISRAGQVVLLSDMFDPEGATPLLAQLRFFKHEPLVLHILDSSDVEPTFTGRVSMKATETGAEFSARITSVDQHNYRIEFRCFQVAIRRACARAAAGLIDVRSDARWETVLQNIVRTGARAACNPTTDFRNPLAAGSVVARSHDRATPNS